MIHALTMKRTNRNASKTGLATVIVGLAVALSPRPAYPQTAHRPSDAPPALQGEDAIRSLKEQVFTIRCRLR